MKRVFCLSAVLGLGIVLGRLMDDPPGPAEAGGAPLCSPQNGDVNADGTIDLSDGVAILGYLFLGSPASLLPSCITPGPPALPATGQRTCFDFVEGQGWAQVTCTGDVPPGQDGFYQTGCPADGRFTDNGDGTVTDGCTGLVWQKNTADVNGDGQVPAQDRTTWYFALTFCEELSFAGRDDWRLPNARELLSLVDYGRFAPAIDPVFGAMPAGYWSSTSFADPDVDAWCIDFSNGSSTGYEDKDDFRHVRAVRNAP